MAFRSKLGGIFFQLLSSHECINSTAAGNAPSLHMFNTIRCMATRIFVGGLSEVTDGKSLREAFKSYGKVTEARVITDKETGKSRRFGFVSYMNDESANQAVSGMDGQVLDGGTIHVDISIERSFRGGSG